MIVLIVGLFVLGVVCAIWALSIRPAVDFQNSALQEPETFPSFQSVRSSSARGLWLSVLGKLGRLSPTRQAGAIQRQLVLTGSQLHERHIAGLKIIGLVLGIVGAVLVGQQLDLLNPVVVVMVGGAGYMVPTVWLRARVRSRQRRILKRLPEVIDLLSLSIGAGMDFLGALNKVLSVKALKGEPLIEELSVVLQEIKLGKRRFEALKTAAKRMNIPEISSFVRTLVQADRMGTPISEVLTIHAEDIRFERFMRAERAALKAPIKILIPLILCIMPCVALIVGAPIFLQFMHQNPFGK